MIKVSDKEFLDWLYSQPDEQMVNMHEAKIGDPCGCLMIQFARSKNWPIRDCGERSFFSHKDKQYGRLERAVTYYFHDVNFATRANFKALKNNLKPEFKR